MNREQPIITIDPEAIAAATAATRIPSRACTKCAIKYPKDSLENHFHRDKASADGWHAHCKDCRNQSEIAASRERTTQAIAVSDQTRTVIGQLIARDDNKTLPHIAHLGNALLEVFGGIEGYAANVKAEYEAADPGSSSRQKYLEMVKQCVAKASDLGATKNPPELMSEEDLESSLLTLLQKTPLIHDATILDTEDSSQGFGGGE